MQYVKLAIFSWFMLLPLSSFAEQLIFVAEDLPPFHYLDDENTPKGALVDIVNAIAKQGNLDIRIDILPFARAQQQTKQQANVFMFSLLKTPSRANSFQWVGQTYKTKAYLVGLKNRNELKLTTLDEAKKFLVGTIHGYYSETYLLDHGFDPTTNLSLSVQYEHMWQKLFKDRIDFVLTNYIALDREIKSLGLDPQAVVPYLELENFPNELYIATGLTTEKITVDNLHTVLEQIKTNGTYQKILNHWRL